MDFKIRSHTKEQLDDLSLSGNTLKKTLTNLSWINSLLGNHRQLSNTVFKYYKKNFKNSKIHIIDLGSGGGDTLYKVSKKLKTHNNNVILTGIDGNQSSTEYAALKYKDIENLKFITSDILDSKFIVPECDILISSHFIYHFKDQELVTFLKKIKENSVKQIIFSELYRSKIAYLLFKIFGKVFPISEMTKRDGLLAIRRAFTKKELNTIITKSNITDYKIYKKPWFRILTIINLPDAKNTTTTH